LNALKEYNSRPAILADPYEIDAVKEKLANKDFDFKALTKKVYLDSENAIRSSECECPRGKFRCSHAAALFIHGIYNFSRRDVECSWKKRKANTPLSWQPFEEMFPPTKQYSSLLRNPTQSDRSGPYRDLQEYGRFTGLCWLMSPEPLELPIPTIEDIIYSEEFLRIQGSQQQIDCLVRQGKASRKLAFGWMPRESLGPLQMELKTMKPS